MTVLDVSVPVYYDTAQKLADAASRFWMSIDDEWPNMAKATNMAGSYSDAKKWGESYDARAAAILSMVSKIATAAHDYATILQTIGYNHEVAEHKATMGETAPPPAQPAPFMPPVVVCRIPLPSAGGPGNGLVDEGIGLAEMIGIIVPDGNATTISNAADTWARTAAADAVASFPAALEAAAVAFDSLTAPEVVFIDEDIRTVKASAESVIAAMHDLAQSCRDHRVALDELRANLKTQLEAIRDALLAELAINAAISIASSWITFGVSAAVGVAGAAAICARYARPIRLMIEQWQTERRIAAGVKLDEDIARHVRDLENLPGGRLPVKPDPVGVPKKDPIELPKIEHPEGIPKVDLPRADIDAIGRYTGNSAPLNMAIRSGDNLTPAQIAERDAMNAALDKCPVYEGPVTRRVDISPEDLARYEPGSTVTEAPFTSASATSSAAKDLPVEMQIWSADGRYIGHHSSVPEELEVVFKTDTPFRVVDKFPDPETGRIIIQMRELPRP
ncbi:hypothetical protein IFM12275_53770 [Nocardia sputorum]|uniref:hypothetical protein n=1 Tax=Nocardia sputorum TaxID=2984338 RepID=UPI00248F75D0|nr:hypothetical protein [Nocardia sputorum]BDT95401.1 hypothetical protein IFM12275_53770 [Nocardia sputorum]